MLSSPATCLGLLVTMHNMHTAAVIINTGRCITTSTAVFGFGRCYALSEARQLLLGPHTAHTISQNPWNFLIESSEKAKSQAKLCSEASSIAWGHTGQACGKAMALHTSWGRGRQRDPPTQNTSLQVWVHAWLLLSSVLIDLPMRNKGDQG